MVIRTYTEPMQPLYFVKKKINLHRDNNPMLFRHWRLIVAAPLFALLFGALIANLSRLQSLNSVAVVAGIVLSFVGLLCVMALIQRVRARRTAK